MTRQHLPEMNLVFAAGLLATASAVVLCVALSSIAKPAHGSERLQALAQAFQRIEALRTRSGDAGAYPARAVCEDASGEQSDALRREIDGLTHQAGLTLAGLSLTRGPAIDRANLTPIKFELAVNGRYDESLQLLQALARAQPLIFVDAIDIKSETSSVDLRVTGNIYCWTSTHP